MSNKTLLQNAVLGSLYGFAIGDAMGATTEFMNEGDIKKTYGKVTDIIGGGWLHLTPGEVTDDTQMMAIVAEACVNPGRVGFSKTCCTGFVKWLEGGPKDVGGACRRAIKQGGSKPPAKWELASMDRQTASGNLDLGNGALMRSLFPALVNRPNWAVQQGRLTHNNPTSDQAIRDYCNMVFTALSFTKNYAIFTRAFSVPKIMRGPLGIPGIVELKEPTGHVENTLNNVVYWTLHSQNFRDSIIGPVNHGGDADTIAALTGGVTGALWGYCNIPEKWIEALNPEVSSQLRHLARKAVRIIIEANPKDFQ